ncbi:hypothetical protein ACHAWF_012934 [Thalassiosira exigua]
MARDRAAIGRRRGVLGNAQRGQVDAASIRECRAAKDRELSLHDDRSESGRVRLGGGGERVGAMRHPGVDRRRSQEHRVGILVPEAHIEVKELERYDDLLAQKPQVVVLNKVDVRDVNKKEEELVEKFWEAAGHSRVMTISAAGTCNY